MPPTQPRDPLAGHLGHLTVPEQHALDKFKKQLEEEGSFVADKHDDATLLRFLRARKFDLPKTKLMWDNSEKWRKEQGVDQLLHFDFPEGPEVMKYYPQYYHKTDKDGRPVYIEQLGKLDIDALYKVTTQDRLLKRLISQYEQFLHERLPATSKVVGHPVETSCTILDLGGVSLLQFYKVKDYVNQASAIGQNYYPECMGKFYIINAPWGFSSVWNLIKPWLDEVTVAKIEVLGTSYKDKLLQQIPKENLPKEFGGECQCSGPGGCQMSNAGPWNVPSSVSTTSAPAPSEQQPLAPPS
ncbi:cytosolic factor, phosphatidylinositol/phosphatidylcholine transfer protein [Tulasnella sp. UAMH 9824]|nr:cytosolic factor, phosphatidylinositol/phosphatidylcholine transfer protein [Tulasnella sp. UAMH 9824]